MVQNASLTASVFLFAALGLAAPAMGMEDRLRILDRDGTLIASFNQAEAEALGTREVVTSTPWTRGIVRFSGVEGHRLLEAAGLSEVDITVIALDDYTVSLSWEDLTERNALFASRVDGERLTLDRKGPFWTVFDFDDIPKTEGGEVRSKTIWHMIEIWVD